MEKQATQGKARLHTFIEITTQILAESTSLISKTKCFQSKASTHTPNSNNNKKGKQTNKRTVSTFQKIWI